jgi:hypothetical protein
MGHVRDVEDDQAGVDVSDVGAVGPIDVAGSIGVP